MFLIFDNLQIIKHMFSHIFESLFVKYIMKKIYLFTLNNFYIEQNGNRLPLCKNSYLKICDIKDDTLSVCDTLCPKNKIEISKNAKTCNFFRVNECTDKFIEIISCGKNNLIEKLKTKNIEVEIYENFLLIIYKNIPYTYYFKNDGANICMELKDKIYIFNKYFLVIFDSISKSFCHLFVEKYSKNNDKIELLCNLPKNIGYLIIISINLNEKTINSKKLKKQNIKIDSNILPYAVFYLSKHSFEEVKSFINENIQTKKLMEYFSEFENIFDIDGKFYLSSLNKITQINFKIKDNVVVEID